MAYLVEKQFIFKKFNRLKKSTVERHNEIFHKHFSQVFRSINAYPLYFFITKFNNILYFQLSIMYIYVYIFLLADRSIRMKKFYLYKPNEII